ncbi:mitochondrial ATP synthase g subunit-domain-containing protein [Paraphysoderma sedebokerense]|nr:mitochondrial ATP synthase g subunit-domain-containing protein [Paraphysoderma sedebokerense]
MLSPKTLVALRTYANAGLRKASTAASQESLNAAAGKASKTLEPWLHRLRVIREIAKEVYVREQLHPPTSGQIQEARKVGESLVKSVQKREFKNWNKDDVAKGAALAVEVAGFFTVGEIVGRRSLIGYDV